ncbi:MAG: type IV pili twitching motility protein PilT [Chloroflexi bacterium RBG_13_51_18]|nr:MAG: type IV pili twitching motility protein PilT [Chloroflexi bacterium RBG_13_51_18]
MHINDLLQLAITRKASDLHLKVGRSPVMRINGELFPQEDAGIITPEIMNSIFMQITTEKQRDTFSQELEADFAYQTKDTGRFRINICQQDGTTGLVCRPVTTEVPTIEGLGLPEICKTLAMKGSGLVIVTGPTGCGKSTTMAAMMNYLNHTIKRKIITIEDPIEYLHQDIKCMFSQRELGRDTVSFAMALKHAMRQDPDVILVGEMRDLETMATVLTAAETGHLVLATLHTPGTTEAINRFIDVFPPHQQQQVRIQLSIALEGVIYQLLIPNSDNSGRIAAIEVMLASTAIRNLIREGKTYQMMNIIQTGTQCGMQTLNQSLVELCKRGLITSEEALARSMDAEELSDMLGRQTAQR